MRNFVLFTIILASPALAQSKPHQNLTSGGRFQLIQLGEFRRDQFLLDTETGRVWESECYDVKNNNCIGHSFVELFVNNLPASQGKDPAKPNSGFWGSDAVPVSH